MDLDLFHVLSTHEHVAEDIHFSCRFSEDLVNAWECVCTYIVRPNKSEQAIFVTFFLLLFLVFFLFILCIMSSAFSSTSNERAYSIRMGNVRMYEMLVTLVNGKFFASFVRSLIPFEFLVIVVVFVVQCSFSFLSLFWSHHSIHVYHIYFIFVVR